MNSRRTWIVSALLLSSVVSGLSACTTTQKGEIKTAAATISCVACSKRMTSAASTRNWNGKTLSFCGPECEKRFVKNPEQFPH